MSIVRWDPFAEMRGLTRAMDRLMEGTFGRPFGLWEGVVLVDMYQTPEAVVVKAALPGVKPEEVEIAISGNTLSLKGEVKAEMAIEREDYFHQERRYGAFSRALTLPLGLQSDKAEASFEHGILTLTIPKAEEIKPKTIKVKTVVEAEKK